jgi:AcrR family transcriptional regulator
MATARPDTLQPRKQPRQARSAVTVAAILEATIQVLLRDGAPQLTTTRVAARAGVSVGTLYQYFPNKQALLYAVLQQQLEAVAATVETACRQHRGQPLADMSDGLVNAYIDAKTTNIKASRALYLMAAEFDTADLLGEISRRIDRAMTAMLATASDVDLPRLPTVTFALRATLAGTVRVVLERGATPAMLKMLRSELPAMCRAYLAAATQRPRAANA